MESHALKCSPEASDKQKIRKTDRPRPRMNEKQKKLLVQGVGKVPNGIFYSSKGWEMQPLRFFVLPKFGKAFFRRFSVFPMLGQPFSSVFCSSQVWEIRFSTFSRLPNFGKVSSADFWFSLAGEIRFSLFPSFPSRGKSVFCCLLLLPREGKLFLAAFLFSPVRESQFLLNSCFPP